MTFTKKSRTILIAGVCLWLAAVVAGVGLMLGYENTPGVAAASVRAWPAGSRIPRLPDMPTLVMMVHPHCPCSRSSIGELAKLVANVHGVAPVNVTILFVRPHGFPTEWEKTDLWNAARIIPGVNVRIDEEGVEAKQFGSVTSGQTMLFGPGGERLFSGGITASRGHDGDNAGRSAIELILTEGSAAIAETPVFGCPLFGNDTTNTKAKCCNATDHE
jgi:hypothetical protein